MPHPLLALLLLAVSPSRAVTLEDARDNVETVIQTYVAQRSGGGTWELKQRGSGKTLRLTLQSVDKKAVQELGSDRFQAFAVFVDRGAGGRSYAAFEIDLGGTEWKVDKMRWITSKEKDAIGRSAAAQAKTAAAERLAAQAKDRARRAELSAKRKAVSGGELLPEVDLPTLGSAEPSPYYACPAKRCVDVYVAPWCPHCQDATPGIIQLREYLKTVGVPLRVTVGMDGEDKVLPYASTFGKDTMLDPDNHAKPMGGVPSFCVYEDGGRVVKRVSGAPADMSDPKAVAARFLDIR